MSSLFSGDNEIGNILQEAVKLKSAQMGQKRKQYETWPKFVQHTLFHSEKDEFKAWRAMPFDEKMKVSDGIKEAGNKLYHEKRYTDAVDKYEEAASLFYYCYSNDPGWRKNNRGIDDDVLMLVDDKGSNDEEAEQVRRLRLSCCLNIAQCQIKVLKFVEAVEACNTALELDPNNMKALYRRAEARVRPSSSTAYDHDCAVKDLSKAAQIDPSDKEVTKLLVILRGEQKHQRSKDKLTFEGMFGRGEIYDKESMEAAENRPLPPSTRWEGLPNQNEIREMRKRVDEVSDDDPLEKRIADAEMLRDLYERNQKHDEAQKLNDQIQNAKRALKEQESTPAPMDFSNPTPEMIADAEKYGLDLRDPLVQAELKRIEREGPAALEALEESLEGSASAAPPPVMQPLPEAPEYVPIPWLRYVLLFTSIAVLARLWTVLVLLRKLFSWLFATRDDPGEVGESFFSQAYAFLTGRGDDGEF